MKQLKILCQYLISSVFIISLLGCGEHSKVWEEEVQLSSGEVIWVKRTVDYKRDSRAFITKEGGNIINMIATITIPANNSIAPPPPVWSFDAVPIVLDYDPVNKTWFVVGTYFYCDSWKAAGQPALGQWLYVVKNDKWVVLPLDITLIGRPTNLFTSFTDNEFRSNKVTKEDINNDTKYLSSDSLYKKVTERKQRCDDTVGFKPGF